MKYREIPSSPKELINSMPKELREILFLQWKAKQNYDWHPEGNTLKHILITIKRAYDKHGDDPNLIMAALFHDLGKFYTYEINPKTGKPTAYGHEKVSVKIMNEFREWIDSFIGVDFDIVRDIVDYHMVVKRSTWEKMRDVKKEKIINNPAYDRLKLFTKDIDGGGRY